MSDNRRTKWTFSAEDQTKAAIASVSGGLSGLNKEILGTIKKYGAVGVAAGLVITGLQRQAKAVYDLVAVQAKAGDEAAKLAKRFGMTVEGLSQYEFAIKRGGGSTSDLATMVNTLSRSMQRLRSGSAEAGKSWDRLGIKADQLIRSDGGLKSVDEMLPMIAEGLRNVQSQAERLDLAQALGGEGATKLLPFLQDGVAGLEAMNRELDKYGGAMSSAFTAKAEKFQDAHTNLANATARLKEALADPFLKPFADAINRLAELLGDKARSGLLKGPGGQYLTQPETRWAEGRTQEILRGGPTLTDQADRNRARAAAYAQAASEALANRAFRDRGLGWSYLDASPMPGHALTAAQQLAMQPRPAPFTARGLIRGGFAGAGEDWGPQLLSQDAYRTMSGVHRESFAAGGQVDTRGWQELGMTMTENAELVNQLTAKYKMLTEEQAKEIIEKEKFASLAPAVQSTITAISTTFDQALFQTLTETRKFGRDVVAIFKQMAADSLAALVGRTARTLLTSLMSGGGAARAVAAGADDFYGPPSPGDKNLVSARTEAVPSWGTLSHHGRYMDLASTTYSKAFV